MKHVSAVLSLSIVDSVSILFAADKAMTDIVETISENPIEENLDIILAFFSRHDTPVRAAEPARSCRPLARAI